MLYFLKLLLVSINIDQETLLNWFGLKDPTRQELQQALESGYDITISNVQSNAPISAKTFQLIIEGLWEKVQNGLTLADIENVLFFILFIRFVILAFRYNLKTSFYITCIGLFAGYLWYRHLIDLITTYQNVLINLPFFNQLGMDAADISELDENSVLMDLQLGDKVHWYNPAQAIYYAFTQGIIHIDPESGNRSYIDPISMIVSNLNESAQSTVVPLYYKIYNKIIPKIYDICSKFWMQLSGVAAYAVITRIGKRYCPYLVRWHWTFLLIIGLIEQIFMFLVYRAFYFQAFVLMPQTEIDYVNPDSLNLLNFQINLLTVFTVIIIVSHLGLVLLALLHAICGQYFYIPFFVENTELHIGPRPKNSIYSGGYTSWQDSDIKERNANRIIPKLWYGWFGRGDKWNIMDNLIELIKMLIRPVTKIFQKLFRKLIR